MKSGLSLEDESEKLHRKLNPEDEKDQAKVKKLREELLGHVVVENLPIDLHEDLTRHHLGLSLNQWREHTIEDRGRMMATYEISNKIELLERYESVMDRNRSSAPSNS